MRKSNELCSIAPSPEPVFHQPDQPRQRAPVIERVAVTHVAALASRRIEVLVDVVVLQPLVQQQLPRNAHQSLPGKRHRGQQPVLRVREA